MLEQLPIPVELLGLENIEVENVSVKNKEIHIKAKSTLKAIPCKKCENPTKPYGFGRTLTLRHLPILGKKTFIEIRPPRGICEICDQAGKGKTTTTQTLSWYNRNGRYTKPYEQQVLLSLINSTIVDVGIKEEISEHAIQNIINRHIDDNVNWGNIEKIGVLGIDEISLKKGYQDFATIITSRLDGDIRILKVITGRLKKDIFQFFKSIPDNKVKTIIAVCSDMYDGFINAAKEAFDGKIPVVVDRFHVACLYRKALSSLRKKEIKSLKISLSKEEYKTLQKAIQILKRNQEFISVSDEEELEKIFKYSPLLKVAYSYCRRLTHIFNAHHTPESARDKIREWVSEVNASDLKCFNKFIATVAQYENEICNYFSERFNSGFVEGANNKIKVLKRRCYGISNIKNLFKRIYLDFSGYGIFNGEEAMLAYA